MRLRDNRRQKLYDAEKVLSNFSKPLPEITDVEEYLKLIWSKKVLQRKFKTALSYGPPQVVHSKSGDALAYGTHKISLPIWARHDWIVIHEISHIICNRTHSFSAGHGWQFCAIYLEVVQTMLGMEAKKALKQSMRQHRVKFREPKPKRLMTPEVLEQLRARMAVARAALIK